ncbi:hypothetical protein [Agrobacterium rosae]|uniref:Uncharacterized protein n=1 Tax=Agrobacterium rosae TaxID=1972867 RepID=A0A1R3U1Y9_9HYPH|nr:hypothetical protein [Agrobacterium rosae]SCX35123.1 hypothetical protein DSM25559_4812 [Agrobacterium rosae]
MQKAASTGSLHAKLAWYEDILSAGFVPYVITSERFIPYLDVSYFSRDMRYFLLERGEDRHFIEAYLLSNALSFGDPKYQLPHWVLIDCGLMQTAVVGFMKPRTAFPDDLLTRYRSTTAFSLDELDHIPISGQILSPTLAGELVGISLFSLARYFSAAGRIGLATKALALIVCKASSYDRFLGVAQYDNPSLAIHGRMSREMQIYQPVLPLHPGADMTFIYAMKIDFDPRDLDAVIGKSEYDYLIGAGDLEAKLKLKTIIDQGGKIAITPPFQIRNGAEILIPIKELDR